MGRVCSRYKVALMKVALMIMTTIAYAKISIHLLSIQPQHQMDNLFFQVVVSLLHQFSVMCSLLRSHIKIAFFKTPFLLTFGLLLTTA